MHLLFGLVILLVVIACTHACYRSKFRVRICGGQLLSFIVASFLPIAVFGLLFWYMSIDLDQAKVLGREQWFAPVSVAALIEEVLKLGALVLVARYGGLPIHFATRAWIGITFGLWEFVSKLFLMPENQLISLEFLAVAASAIGIHALSVFYPNTMNWQRVTVIFFVSTAYHVLHNSLVLKVLPGLSTDGVDQYQLLTLFFPWVLYIAAFFIVLRSDATTPKLWI
jgi:hypothetical protein